MIDIYGKITSKKRTHYVSRFFHNVLIYMVKLPLKSVHNPFTIRSHTYTYFFYVFKKLDMSIYMYYTNVVLINTYTGVQKMIPINSKITNVTYTNDGHLYNYHITCESGLTINILATNQCDTLLTLADQFLAGVNLALGGGHPRIALKGTHAMLTGLIACETFGFAKQ